MCKVSLFTAIRIWQDKWYGRLGLIKGKLARSAGRLADWTWLGATLVALIELSMKRNVVRTSIRQRRRRIVVSIRRLRASAVESRLYRESMQNSGEISSSGRESDEQNLRQLAEQIYWIRINRSKLIMDLVFVCEFKFRSQKGLCLKARQHTLALIWNVEEKPFKPWQVWYRLTWGKSHSFESTSHNTISAQQESTTNIGSPSWKAWCCDSSSYSFDTIFINSLLFTLSSYLHGC